MFEVSFVEGVVRWSSQEAAVGACHRDDQIIAKTLEPDDQVLVEARVLPVGSTHFIRDTQQAVARVRRESDGRSFTPAAPPSESNRIHTHVGVRRKFLKRLNARQYAVPPEVALAALTTAVEGLPPMFGIHWSDGQRDLEVIVKDTWLHCINLREIEEQRSLVPWWDLSHGRSIRPLDSSVTIVSQPIDQLPPPPEFLAMGGALAALRPFGSFVNEETDSTDLGGGKVAIRIPLRALQS